MSHPYRDLPPTPSKRVPSRWQRFRCAIGWHRWTYEVDHEERLALVRRLFKAEQERWAYNWSLGPPFYSGSGLEAGVRKLCRSCGVADDGYAGPDPFIRLDEELALVGERYDEAHELLGQVVREWKAARGAQ